MASRWWIYQRERFPVFAHGPMVLIFSLSVMLFSSLQANELPNTWRFAGAAISALIFFFQLRVADEFKDFEIDSKFRPERPVPQGLVGLGELAHLAWLGAVVQFVIAINIDFGLVPLLALVWLYIGLMTKEFFMPDWLKKTPSAYLLSHMVVMPLIALYISAFDWICECRELPAGLGWLLLLSFGCGLVLELGRKIRTTDAEREGVETYSATWGRRMSLSAWALSVAVAAGAYSAAGRLISDDGLYLLAAIVVVAMAALVAMFFPEKGWSKPAARLIEPGSGLIAMLLYLGLGPLQALLA